MFSTNDVLETVNMIEREHLDIRTVTMGISLMSCISGTAQKTADKVYDTICKRAENIVKVTGDLSREYGIPIVNDFDEPTLTDEQSRSVSASTSGIVQINFFS